MTAPCPSNTFSIHKDNTILWNDQRNMFDSNRKILHDPECQTHCCSENYGQPIQVDNFGNLKQYSNFSTYYSDDSSVTSTTCEIQSLYDSSTLNNQASKFQEELSQSVIDRLAMPHSQFDYEKPIKRQRYSSCSVNINLHEAQRKQRSYHKDVMKRKRKRTIFSTEQIIIMEGVFKKRPYVNREERLFLSHRLDISEKAIKIWFQNRRRVTEKREKDQSDSYSDSTVEDVCNNYNTRLDYIESQINQNTDEFGFVTLDSLPLAELIKLIDNVLSRNLDYPNSTCEIKNNENYVMYEPVSPEGFSDDNDYRESDNILNWEPSEPEESLQRLIDIQAVLQS